MSKSSQREKNKTVSASQDGSASSGGGTRMCGWPLSAGIAHLRVFLLKLEIDSRGKGDTVDQLAETGVLLSNLRQVGPAGVNANGIKLPSKCVSLPIG